MSVDEDLSELHARLINGELRAASKIVEQAILPLVRIVSASTSLKDRQEVEQQCFDALHRYLGSPSDYQPTKAPLLNYLAAIAIGLAKTAARSANRRILRDGVYAQLRALEGPVEEESLRIRVKEWPEVRKQVEEDLVKDPGDAELLDLMADGEDCPANFAAAIGMVGDEAGQEEAMKRVERMRGRIRRLGKRNAK